MGEEKGESFPKLKLLLMPSMVMEMEMPDSPEHPSTPPFQASSASVPFKWEEQPGKPRPCITPPEPAKSLELPPHRFIKTPSPTTVLDGPYNVARPKFSSFRFLRDDQDSFRSPEGTTFDFEALLGAKKSGGGGGLFGKFKGGKTAVVSCRFSPSSVSSSCEIEERFVGVKSNCGVKISRNGSFSSISQPKSSSSSHIWVINQPFHFPQLSTPLFFA